MKTNTLLKQTLLLISISVFGIYASAQNQSLLLPVPAENSSVINFIDPSNPIITNLLAAELFRVGSPSGPIGNPHVEADLAFAYPSMDENYLGQHPMFAQTVVHDKDGNLLFFIVDNDIYNKYGETFSFNNGQSLLWASGTSRITGQLGPEIVVFPIYDNNQCYKFGIVFSACACNNHIGGANFVYYRTLTYYDDESISLTDPILISEHFSDASGCGNFININLAISEYRADYQNYLLFVHYYNRLVVLTVGPTGIINTNPYNSDNNPNGFQEIPLTITYIGLLQNITSEMEVIKKSENIEGTNQDVYYVAMGSYYGMPNECKAKVHVVSLNYSDHLVRQVSGIGGYNFTTTLTPADGPSQIERIKGLEFSPDGSKLYVTYTGQPSLN